MSYEEWTSANERNQRLFNLHLEYIKLCADDVITESEHRILEDALDAITTEDDDE